MEMTSDSRGTIVAPAVRDLDALGERLTQWLGERMPYASDIRLTDLSYPRGAGQSHETILFDAHWNEDGAAHSEGLVVRIKPSSFTVFLDDMFVEEYQLMRVLHERGTVPVAEVRWYEDDPSLLGAPFFIMSKVTGRVPVSIPSYMDTGFVAEATAEQRAIMWDNCVRALAAVQTVPLDAVPFLALPSGGTGFEQEWERWERFFAYIDRPDRPLPASRELLERLRASIPDNQPEGIIWGDARPGNIMLDDDFRVVALFDWEQPSLGGALQDLGWWLFNQRCKIVTRDGESLPGILDRAETIALWHEVSRIPTEGIDWYEAFAGFKFMCLAVNMMDMRGIPIPHGDDSTLLHVKQSSVILTAIEEGQSVS